MIFKCFARSFLDLWECEVTSTLGKCDLVLCLASLCTFFAPTLHLHLPIIPTMAFALPVFCQGSGPALIHIIDFQFWIAQHITGGLTSAWHWFSDLFLETTAMAFNQCKAFQQNLGGASLGWKRGKTRRRNIVSFLLLRLLGKSPNEFGWQCNSVDSL